MKEVTKWGEVAGFSKACAGFFPPHTALTLDQSHLITSEKLLLVIETVSLSSGKFVFVLLNYFLEGTVQLLLLLLKKLLFLEKRQMMKRDFQRRVTVQHERLKQNAKEKASLLQKQPVK